MFNYKNLLINFTMDKMVLCECLAVLQFVELQTIVVSNAMNKDHFYSVQNKNGLNRRAALEICFLSWCH